MSFEDGYQELMAKPIDEIREDIFFRADNFRDEPWYDEFQIYMVIGICEPPEEYALQVRKALKVMGYDTHTTVLNGKTYIVPGEIRQEPKEKTGHGQEVQRNEAVLCFQGRDTGGQRRHERTGDLSDPPVSGA